jgi:poly(3-hydroxybutyrate) depolymerase
VREYSESMVKSTAYHPRSYTVARGHSYLGVMLVAAVLVAALGVKPSPGCGKQPAYTPGAITEHQLDTNDTGLPAVRRGYHIRVPEFANGHSAIPLMFMFHGQGGNAGSTQRGLGQYYPNFVVVAPQVGVEV